MIQYETEADRDAEVEIMKALLKRWGKEYTHTFEKLSMDYHLDFAIVSSETGQIECVVEVKSRKTYYKEVILSQNKVAVGMDWFNKHGIPAVFAVAMPDEYGIPHVRYIRMDRCARMPIFWGGRGDRKKREPLVKIPTEEMRDAGVVGLSQDDL